MQAQTQRDAIEKRIQRIYRQLQEASARFLDGVEGCTPEQRARCRDWIITHLMVLFFLQQRGFIEHNPHYLQEQFVRVSQDGHSFYRRVLLPLFGHLGAAPKLPGNQPPAGVPAIPALFSSEELWEDLVRLQIPDEAFSSLFSCFSAYRWQLENGADLEADVITPQLVTYLLEQRLGGKDGAYYTPEDVTEYIARNCVVPALFDRIGCRFPAYSDPASISSPWWRVASDPDRYLFDAVKKGVRLPLPPEIAVGLESVAQREQWNRPAFADYGLPTETWREVVERRRRYEEVKAAMAEGKVTSIDAFITYNLNVRLFAQDVIEQSRDPAFLLACYEVLVGTEEEPGLSILDPTCGAGAFLQAGLAVLEPLYTACLSRMQALLTQRQLPYNLNVIQLTKMLQILGLEARHPNRRYFVRKMVVLNNLYGVDMTLEAVDTCKVCLLLKLAAAVEQVEDLEALPDLDFTICHGNALIGIATAEDLRKLFSKTGTAGALSPRPLTLLHARASSKQAGGTDELKRIEQLLHEMDQLTKGYHRMQLEHRRQP